MAAEVTVKAVEPTTTAVVTAATTWAEFPKMWGPMPSGLPRSGTEKLP